MILLVLERTRSENRILRLCSLTNRRCAPEIDTDPKFVVGINRLGNDDAITSNVVVQLGVFSTALGMSGMYKVWPDQDLGKLIVTA